MPADSGFTPPVLISSACPSRMVLEMLADKWKLLVFHALHMTPVMRNGELMRALQGISQKMLTQTLRSLERDGLIERRDFGEVPPRVEYSLTPLGRTLGEPIALLSHWGAQHYPCVEEARLSYDKQESAQSG